jgi:hypothetical protein
VALGEYITECFLCKQSIYNYGRDHLRNLHKDAEKNIKVHFRETTCEDMKGIHLAHKRVHWWELINIVLNLKVPGDF